MSNGFPLPLECLQLVIINLAINRELKTLTSLLRVSKHACLATLPVLYEDPFVWFLHRNQGQQSHYTIRSYRSVIPVIRLLFAHVPKESYSGLLKAMYGIEDQSPEVAAGASEDLPVVNDNSSTSTSQHWPIDYLSYVRHFNNQDRDSKSVLVDLSPHAKLQPGLKSYVEEHKLAETYAETGLNLVVDWRSRNVYKEDPTMISYLKLEIHREATWALCSPILEQLQSIIIPLSDISHYIDSISRLSSLASVTFRLDELADTREHSLEQMDAEEVKKLGRLQKKREQDLETAVEFVRIHTVMFRGTLKQVHCPSVFSILQSIRQSCPADILNRMLEFLPALIDPLELVNKNWEQFTAKAEHTNLDHVKTIDVWQQFASKSYDQLKSKPFLHRCLSLRKYHMISLGSDSFRWAVKDISLNDQVQREQAPSASEIVPPLEDINIQAHKEPFGRELDDIGRGCGATIKTFTIQGFRQTQETDSRSLSIGHEWRMPVLSSLRVNSNSERLVVDSDFLRYCPSLKFLFLVDYKQTYDLSEIKVVHPVYLPELTGLILGGTGAFCFHPDTLHSTKELRVMSLGSQVSCRLTVIPSLQDIDRDDRQQNNAIGEDADPTTSMIVRPKWTWDWHLPLLTTLHMTVEFAFHFQFRMLQGTPNLRDLYLCLYSTVHPTERVLTKADFTISRLHDQDQEDDTDSRHVDGSESTGHDSTTTTATTISHKDPNEDSDKFDLHHQSSQTLHHIHTYLFLLSEDRKNAAFRAEQCPGPVPDEALSALQLHTLRENIMFSSLRQIFWDAPRLCASHPDGSCPEKSNPGAAVKIARKIEELVDQVGLRAELEEVVAELQIWQAREREEEEGLKKYRVEHPDHLVVPSLKKLELYGRWIMSDEVLEILLGRVFRNVQDLHECLTEGYSFETLVRVTQSSMPALKSVHLVNPFDSTSVSDAYKLQSDLGVFKKKPPFMNDARTRVRYKFLGKQSYYRASDEPNEQTVEASVE
ncbi:hypothetical protein CPC16_010372 [Podila verticillata]|nr:hypothetical protein CPC16_010372 [Podila verticillata]